MGQERGNRAGALVVTLLVGSALGATLGVVGMGLLGGEVGATPPSAAMATVPGPGQAAAPARGSAAAPSPRPALEPRRLLDFSGFPTVLDAVKPWAPDASLPTIAEAFRGIARTTLDSFDRVAALIKVPNETRVSILLTKAMLWNYEGRPDQAYVALQEARSVAESDAGLASKSLATILYFQGICALRRGENENCIDCRGESSCILPIVPAARHIKPEGSRLAIRHFTEYLQHFPDDLEARWLLNLAHMTLGEHPAGVDPRYVISLQRFEKSEFDIGRFRDVGHLVGVNRLNQAGGAAMDDFDGDGRLDLIATSISPTTPVAFFRNTGDGTFEDRAQSAGLADQLGGLNCVQADYNNDGHLDLYVPRGAWVRLPMRPSLLRNNGDGTFVDATKEAGLLDPVNSNSACWADYDNDGWLDLFVCCERQPNRLFRNAGDGTFEEVAARVGLGGNNSQFCKGANWIDFDNDDYPDLFVNNLFGRAQLFRNDRHGAFVEVGHSRGVDGPEAGFSCWAFDFDNDGWLDIFATCYERTLGDVVKGITGQPHALKSNRLFRNLEGKRFQDVTSEAGLDLVLATMGSNFGDFDNDGFLDFYLGTGEPNIATLVPNRMFKNVDGKRFAEITGTSGTGNLQKGHGVACGDWDRDGDVDLFIQMGGVTDGDMYHNILFQNPGQGNHSLTVKLVGTKTNRSAIGARIKVVTDGESPSTFHRHVSTGSSFGANPLEQTIGLGKARRVSRLEVHWPTSGTTQVFEGIDADQVIEITELAEGHRTLERPRIAVPE